VLVMSIEYWRAAFLPVFVMLMALVLCEKFINPYPTAFPYGNGMVLHF